MTTASTFFRKFAAIPYDRTMIPIPRRIFDANDWRSFAITEKDIRRSRRAYFANISYLDDKIGDILDSPRCACALRRITR
jgi:choline-sulfatase